jgi:hypothetical protein
VATGKLFIHIGGPKTATTAIQTALAENRDVLRRNAILYPGTEINQQFAMYPLSQIDGYENFASSDPEPWKQIVEEVNNWDGDAILSGEALFLAPSEVVAEIIGSFNKSNVEILITARTAYEIVISHWQESVKAGDTISLHQFAHEVALGPKQATWKSMTFWAIAFCSGPIQSWGSIAGIDNVIVQVVDTTKRDETLRLFEQIVGIPLGLLGISLNNPVNRSLTYPETELIRACNEILLSGAASNHLYSTVDYELILQILLSKPCADDATTELPKNYYESIAPFVNAEVERILNSGARIVGNSSMLTRMPQTSSDSRSSQVKVDLELIRIVLTHYLLHS